jgi:hypothetical protein
MKKLFYYSFMVLLTKAFFADRKVYVDVNNSQMKLKVNGKDLVVNGMNWDYFPIGTNYNYSQGNN